jgi:hypothetical protein
MVASDQVRCSNCHGIQVKVLEPSPLLANYLERVVTASPFTTGAGAPIFRPPSEGKTLAPPSPPPEPANAPASNPWNVDSERADPASSFDRGSYCSEDADDGEDEEDDETLEASPRPTDFLICEGDELRPVDPVAATLASVPSPVPVSLKLDPSFSALLPAAESTKMTAAAAATTRNVDASVPPALSKRSARRGFVDGDYEYELQSAGTIPLLPPKKKLRTA